MLYTMARQAVSEKDMAIGMRLVYNYMTGGVALTALISYLLFSYENGVLVAQIAQSGLMWVFVIAQLGIVLGMGLGMNKLQPAASLGLFVTYAALNGLTLSPILLVYTGASVVNAFLVASAMFAGMSFIGYTTKKSLSGLGTFFTMALIGLVVVSVVNIFMQSNMMSTIISLIAVPLFAGLTAYETQNLKEAFMVEGADDVNRARVAIQGALSLYINFIAMFIHLLRFIGVARGEE